jgi:signal transduction histidine kinase
LGLVLGTAFVTGVLGAGATALGRAHLAQNDELVNLSLDGPSIVALAVASAFFLAAGVMRLSRWRMSGEPHSALAGAALLVMGGLSLPLGGLALLFPGAHDTSFVGPASRTIAELAAVALLIRALTADDVTHLERPGRLLPGLFGCVSLVFLALLIAQSVAPTTVTGETLPIVLMSCGRVLAWFGVALYAASRAQEMPWARSVAPLLVGMGFAESLRGLDVGQPGTWTFAALLLCVSMAALAARAAMIDLEEAVRADEHGRTALSQALSQASEAAEEMTEWREQLTHDARNACAGLHAALTILDSQDDRIDDATRERVRQAAVQELRQIEHLLTRSSDEPCATFEVGAVVRSVAEAAWAVGARVSVQGLPVHAVGRPGDLAAVLKNLLVNAATHAPGSQVRLRIMSDDDTVTVTCADDGPGLCPDTAARAFERGFRGSNSPGSGLGLHGARELMREQGGELELAPSKAGAMFAVTLHRATVTTLQPRQVLVPAQRSLDSAPDNDTHALPVS